MISEERIRYMTKLESFATGEGRESLAVANYSKGDYFSLMLMKYFILGTVTYAIVWFAIMYVQFTGGSFGATTEYMSSLVIVSVVAYIVFMTIYLTISIMVSMHRFRMKKIKLKPYRTNLKELNDLYQLEERLKKEVTMTHAQMWGLDLEEDSK